MAAIIRKIQSTKFMARAGASHSSVAPVEPVPRVGQDLIFVIRAPVAPSPNIPSPISTLPNELLQYMFHYHACNETSLFRIRLTCRLWHDLVASDPTLPCRIRLARHCPCQKIGKGRLEGQHSWDYCCRSIRHLARTLIRYVQTRRFELLVPFLDEGIRQPSHVWRAVPWDRFQRQCISLKVHSFTGRRTINTRELSEYLPPLLRLRSLTLLSQPAVISNVLNKIPGTDNHLEELSIQYVSGQRVFFDPKQFRRILSRILSFQISFGTPHPTAEFCSALLSSFRNLQSLKWVSTSLKFEVVRELRDAVEWQFTLRYLWTQDTLLSTFPSPVLYNLTTLRVDGTRLKFEAETLVLPNLMELCLFGAWIYILQIQAPKLAYLCLRKGAVMPSNVLIPQLVNTQLRPSRLEVDEIVSGSLTEALITGPFKYITELHVWIGAYSARYTYLIPLMRRKPQGGPMFCPRLRHLVVSLYPSGVIKDIPRFRSALVNVLRRGSEVTEMPTVRCMEHDL